MKVIYLNMERSCLFIYDDVSSIPSRIPNVQNILMRATAKNVKYDQHKGMR